MTTLNLTICSLMVISCLYTNSYSQEPHRDSVNVILDYTGLPSDNKDTRIYTVAQEMPLFPNGGREALGEYLKSTTTYPSQLTSSKNTETILVKFIVEKNGSRTQVQALTGTVQQFIEEAYRVINCMPNWKPGMQDGKPIRVAMVVPIRFCPAGCAGW